MATSLFPYYLRLALRSLRRNPALTVLMIAAIGLGVAASMTTYSVLRAVSGDPIPQKSSVLFNVQIDNWGPTARLDYKPQNRDEPPHALSYTDAMAVLNLDSTQRRTALYPVSVAITPANPEVKPFDANGHAVTADFFTMFDVPFSRGAGWSAGDDADRAPVVVLGKALAEKLFGTDDPVGREVTFGEGPLRVAGVMDDWHPQPRFYDLANSSGFGDADQFFLPLATAVGFEMRTAGNVNCQKSPGAGWQGLLDSECVWAGAWVELADPAAVARYGDLLQAYASEQQRAGRFQWPANTRLRDVRAWLVKLEVVPDETRVSALIALGFLVVCLVNVIGLMLAKFMRRAVEIGVRRALGASRREIVLQFLIEAGVVGMAGGLLGLALTALGVIGVKLVFDPDIARLAKLDAQLVALTLLAAIVTTVLAGLYPTIRAARVIPAWQLKSN